MSRQGMLRLVEQPVGHAEQLLAVLGVSSWSSSDRSRMPRRSRSISRVQVRQGPGRVGWVVSLPA
jgi:hypothetical protein